MELARSDEIEAQWAYWLGCPVDELRQPGTRLLVSVSVNRDDVRLLVRPRTCIVRCHPHARPRIEAALPSHDPRQVLRAEDLGATLDANLGEPESVLYIDEAHFEPTDPDGVRPLSPDDAEHLSRLCQACLPIEVERAEIELTQPLVVGLFDASRLIAAAGYLVPGGPIADIGVLTHPDARGSGAGSRVAGAVCAAILARGLVPQWWSLVSNRGSLGIAARLGFQPWAREEWVRLPDVAPQD